ncbi:MAG: hypothetical protein KatS3mg022_1521 [Armatimonadota bacterium]|nr:MAG: hypothetical protein KatS3mg022_1521 [Armatimonadota bacterium]
MEHTVYDLDRMQAQGQMPPAPLEYPHWFGAAVTIACILGALIWAWRFLGTAARHEPALVQRSIELPSPQPLSVRAAPPPVVVVTPSSVMPQRLQLPPPRPSLWEIRAELKRGLGEWEFPHYVNAPHYGFGPDSPAPSQLRPHVAAAMAE